ncbi:putative FHIP family protein [Halotydeus destructor]|nr:putative FHIP family protein [Halotydeus destructor]
MSWLKKGQSFVQRSMSSNKNVELDGPRTGRGVIDGRAALDTFKAHWLQAWEIIGRKVSGGNSVNAGDLVTQDDVVAVVNHLDQMVLLLIQESQGMTSGTRDVQSGNYMISPLLDYLFMESILDKLLTWSTSIGQFTNVMKLEQLKLYELLVSQLCHQSALFQKPLVRPLLQLLAICSDCAPFEVEKRLVILLNSLCAALSQNPELLELFFMPKKQGSSYLSPTLDPTSHSSPQLRAKLASMDKPEARFLIFSLLIPFVHREGPIGQQARDALLLIMSMSRKHNAVGVYIAENSNFCPVLATGLSGLYSSLPRKLSSEAEIAEDWCQFTTEDVHETTELLMFLNSLGFCNAVVQVSHPMVQKQLLEYIYQGFLFSVLAPALHQDIVGIPLNVLENNPTYSATLDEIIAATAYMELFLRTISDPALLQVFLRFICTERFENQRVLDSFIARLHATSKLGVVTLALFRTILEINCEDVMLELVFRHLMPCKFMKDREKQAKRLDDIAPLIESADMFLTCIPSVCYASIHNPPMIPVPGHYNLDSLDSLKSTHSSESLPKEDSPSTVLFLFNYTEYLNQAHDAIVTSMVGSSCWSCVYDASSVIIKPDSEQIFPDSGIYMINNQSANDRSSPNQVPSDPSSSPVTDPLTAKLCEAHDWPSPDETLIGPFLHNLLVRLEDMVNYDFYSNLQLTGLISLLSSSSHGMLRSYLLNNSLVAVENAKTLTRTVLSLRNMFEMKSREIQNLPELQYRAKKFLSAREERNFPSYSKYAESHSTSRVSLGSIESGMDESKSKENKRRSFKEMFGFGERRQSRSNEAKQLKPVLESLNAGYRFNNQLRADGTNSVNEGRIDDEQRLALALIIFEEFLKELSALCQEHYVLETSQLSK